MDIAPCSINMGRIYPPFVFGVIMLIRFFLIYLISFSAFADCPAGESIGSYPISTPQTFCADYIGNHCAVVCGWSSGQPAVCVGTATAQGPYRLTGASCEPHDSGGTVDCSLTPTDPSCFITPPDCAANPTDPACSSGGGSGGGVVNCTATPNDPACSTVDCVNQPSNPACATNFAADISGYYHDSNGKVRTMLLNSNFGHDIAVASSKVTDELSYLRQSVGNSISTSNNLLTQINQNISSLKDDSHNLINSSIDHLSNIEQILKNPLSNSSSSASSTIDYSKKLSSITDILNNMYYYASQMNSSLYSMRWDTNNLNSMQGSMFNIEDYLSKINKTLSNQTSGSGGTGSGGGEGSGTGPSVGTAQNPAHVASSLYKSCTDCVVDIEGAQSELDASKEKLKTTIKTIQTDFKNIFTFDSGAGSGSSAIASCWDFGDLIGKKCMQVDETWALLKALVLFIFLIAIVFMFTRGD